MPDNIWWKLFEKTGNIDAYLLYANMKNKNIVDIELDSAAQIKVTNIN